MPAKSKAQQKFMGIVHSIQKGDAPASKFSKKAQKVAKSIKKKDAEDFASTKHKGLPKKVKKRRFLHFFEGLSLVRPTGESSQQVRSGALSKLGYNVYGAPHRRI